MAPDPNKPVVQRTQGETAVQPIPVIIYATLIFGAALGMATGFAIMFHGTFGIFVKPLGETLGWDRAAIALILTSGFLGYGIGSPVVGALYDKLGFMKVQSVAILVFATGMATLAFLPPFLPAYMAVGLVLGLSGAATSPSGYVLILTRTVHSRLGLTVGLAMLGLGLGLSFAPALANYLINLLGWRSAYVALGAIGLVGGGIALTLITLARVRMPVAKTEEGTAVTQTGLTLGQALVDWRFWLLGGTSMLVSLAATGMMVHLPAAMSDRGLSQGAVVTMAGLLGFGILVGRVGAAVAMDRFFAPAIAFVCYTAGAAGLYSLAVLPLEQLLLLQICAFATGLLAGSEGDVMPFLARYYFGLAHFGKIFGSVIACAAVGGLIGPVLYGYAFDVTGSYSIAIHLGAITCVVCGAALMAMGRYRYAMPVKTAH